LRIEILLKFIIRELHKLHQYNTYLIPIFKFAVISTPVLHCVVCQVDQPILHVFYIVLFAARSQIPLCIEIAFEVAVDCRR